MNDPKALRFVPEPPHAADPGSAYAGRTRYTQLEYEALLGNLPLGIAFTRERRFFLCNPKFADMFGYGPEELIGMAGDVVYASRESYQALGEIAGPMLSAGRQLDVEWEVRRKDGSTFVCRMIAKTLDPADPQQGTVWIVEDITDRRRHADEAARLLREQEATLGTASVGIVFLKDRRIVRCNRRYEEMYGYAPGELLGKPTAVLYANPADLDRAGDAYDQLRRGITARRVEQRKRKDGSVFWTRADGRAVDPQHPLAGSVWTVEDVTEQRRAEDELQRVLAEQQALLDNVVVGIAISRERKVVRCNRRFEEMFGFGAGDANGASWRQMYFTDEEFELRGQVYAELDQGRTHAREQWLRRQDGSGFWCKVSGRAVAAGDPARGYVWLAEDISERRRADEALERLVREQDAVLQNAVTGIIFVKDRRIVRCNRRFEELFGYGQGELLNGPTRFMFASDADYEAGGEPLYEPVWRGETVYIQRRHVRKDGTLIWCSLSGRAVQPGDPAQGSVWLFDDITQEHEAEERVQRALAEQELILDNASVGIAFVRNRAIQRCNRFLEDMVGAGPGELIGESTASIFASHDRLGGGRTAHLRHDPAGRHLRRRGALPPARRQHVHLPRARPAHRHRRGGAGVDLELRRRNRGARGRDEGAARARRAGSDPGQRHRRHRLRAQSRDPALQPLPRGDVRRAPRLARRPAVVDAVRERGRMEGSRAPRVRGNAGGRHPRRRRAPETRGRFHLPLLHARPAYRRGRGRAGVDLELRGRERRARSRPARAGGPRRARAHGRPSAPPSWRRRRRAPSTSPTMTPSPGCRTGACWRTG